MNWNFKKAALAAVMVATAGLAQAGIVLNKDYTVLANPQPSAAKGKVEVIEFFSYTCIHCYHLEPFLASWEKRLPADVSFRREQIVWEKPMEGFARLFATLNTTGAQATLHRPVFDAVMQQKINLGDEKVLTGWLKGRQGIDVARFMQVYQSFGTNAQVTRATKMTRDYGIEGTPTIVVAGKYATMAAAPERLLQVVDELIVKARKEGLAK